MMSDYLREPLIEPIAALAVEQAAQYHTIPAVVDSPVVIDLDVEAGQERRDLESRRAAKQGLATMSMGLGFIVGVLINLGGFGGESLFVALATAKGIDLYENRKDMILTVAFWSTMTITLFLFTRFLVLSMMQKILEGLRNNRKSTVETTEEEGVSVCACPVFKDTDAEEEEDEVSSNLDYLDDRFLISTLLGSSCIGIITNVYMKLYLSGIGQLLGLAAVVAVDYCLIRNGKKKYYEEPKET